MHAISPYLLRCFNPSLPGKSDQKYAKLDMVGKYDTFQLLEAFISSNSSVFKIIEDSKQVYRFNDFTYDKANRQIYGWFQVGIYGVKNDIINIESGDVDFEKAQNNAEIINHYIHFFIPEGFNEGIGLFHNFRGNGVKTLFSELFRVYFLRYTKLHLQVNPLSYDNAISAWHEANSKEVRITKFVALSDKADQIKKLGHHEKELVIKPPRNGSLGKLKDFLTPGTESAKIIESLSPLGEKIKTVVELDGKQRTFYIGGTGGNVLCEIEIDFDKVKNNDGNPEIYSLYIWCKGILSEYATTMYPGIKVAL